MPPSPTDASDPPAAAPHAPTDAPPATSRFRGVLVRVLLVQAAALAGLALLQRAFTP